MKPSSLKSLNFVSVILHTSSLFCRTFLLFANLLPALCIVNWFDLVSTIHNENKVTFSYSTVNRQPQQRRMVRNIMQCCSLLNLYGKKFVELVAPCHVVGTRLLNNSKIYGIPLLFNHGCKLWEINKGSRHFDLLSILPRFSTQSVLKTQNLP